MDAFGNGITMSGHRQWLRALMIIASTLLLCLAAALAREVRVQNRPQTQREPLPHFLFFYNTLVASNQSTLQPQMGLATQSGVSAVTFPIRVGLDARSDEDFADADSAFSRIDQAGENVQFLPRFRFEEIGPNGARYDAASDMLPWEPLDCSDEEGVDARVHATIKATVARYAGKYPGRVIGYHVANHDSGEWFVPDYRTKGPDASVATTRAFRQWLRKNYTSDKALSEAWQRRVDFSSASVPAPDGRFPMRRSDPNDIVRAFYSPSERDWVDYSRFVSDMTASRIVRQAKAVKEAAPDARTVAFYGYVFEAPGSFSGHLDAEKVLASGLLDALAGPISYIPYEERLDGGPGSPMSAVDSMPLRGGFWFNEEDIRTHAQLPGVTQPAWYWDQIESSEHQLTSAAVSKAVYERNHAFAAAHNYGMWWMDLWAGGWFSDADMWSLASGAVANLLVRSHEKKETYKPDFAVIVDERCRFLERFTWTGFFEIYPVLRNSAMSCGARPGFYYLTDFLAGRVPSTRLVVFANIWQLSDDEIELLYNRLLETDAMAVWQYAPGFLNEDSGGPAGVAALTGFEVETIDGPMQSAGHGRLAGINWGANIRMEPRLSIQPDADTEVLGHYPDNLVSAGLKKWRGVTNLLVCDLAWTPQLLASLFVLSGGSLSCDPPSVVHGDGSSWLFVYATRAGEFTVRPPWTKDASKPFSLRKGESRLFQHRSSGRGLGQRLNDSGDRFLMAPARLIKDLAKGDEP